jgi:hypothetical protein
VNLSATDPPPSPTSGWRIAVPAVLLFLLIPIYGISVVNSKIGLNHDAGIYVATAKSLAEGNGYRIAGYPGGLPQTKYPPLLPLILSAVWRISPNFPQNEWLFKLVPVLALLAWSLACVWFFRTKAKIGLDASLWILVFTLTNLYCLLTTSSIMSEALYGVLVIASLAFLARAGEQPDDWRNVVVAALLAGAAYQTRTAGVSLVVAGIAALLIRKRFKHAVLFAAITGVFVVAWMIWQAQPSDASTMTERYYTAQNYRDLNALSGVLSADAVVTVGLHNLFFIALSPARTILQIPASSGYSLLIALVPSAVFWFLVARGVRRAPPSLWPAALFASTTMGMLVVYAWAPTRFLLPILPILMLYAFLGLPRRPPGLGILCLAALPMTSAFLFAQNSWTHGVSDFPAPFGTGGRANRVESIYWNRVTAVYDWIGSHTPRDAVILANYDSTLFLYTGRMSMRPDAASWLDLFDSTRRALPEKIAEFEALVRKIQPTYLVETGNDDEVEVDFYRMLDSLAASGRLRLVKHIAPRYNIYRITPDGWEPAAPILKE